MRREREGRGEERERNHPFIQPIEPTHETITQKKNAQTHIPTLSTSMLATLNMRDTSSHIRTADLVPPKGLMKTIIFRRGGCSAAAKSHENTHNVCVQSEAHAREVYHSLLSCTPHTTQPNKGRGDHTIYRNVMNFGANDLNPLLHFALANE
jgi:hypothetical protein